jgi:hypothetical protein
MTASGGPLGRLVQAGHRLWTMSPTIASISL